MVPGWDSRQGRDLYDNLSRLDIIMPYVCMRAYVLIVLVCGGKCFMLESGRG